MKSLLRTILSVTLFTCILIGDSVGLLATPRSSVPQAPGLPGIEEGVQKKKRKKANRTQRQRTYTRRGTPNVTRRVATELLIERLPELAALVNLGQVEDHEADTTDGVNAVEDSEDPMAAVPTAGVVESAEEIEYEDREMLEMEDPDQLSEEDEEFLEMSDDEMTIDAFYRDFTEYMRALHGELHITDNGIDMILAMETLMDWLGTRYLFGGTSKGGIDCSAFTRTMYRECGVQLPRTAAMQWGAGGESVERDELQFGDLVFFHTRKAVYVSHVGIYLGNGMFCHASSRNGVTVSSLESNYYSTHYIGGRRFDFTEVDKSEEESTAGVERSSDTTTGDVANTMARSEG